MDRKFTLNISGTEYQVEIDGNSLLVDGQPFVIGMENGVLTVDGIVYDVSLGSGMATVEGQEYAVKASGMSIQASAPKKVQAKKKKAAAGAGTVAAMMPGAILKVLVAEGEEVQEGDVVIVLEAMKMENEIHAHKSGVVEKVHVEPGENVENDQPLVEIG